MSTTIRREPLGKKLLRTVWSAAQTMSVLASVLTAGRHGPVRLFYGGARSGNLGGPQVKIKRLTKYFPESRWHYNVAYILSNAPYLSATAIDWLKMRSIPIVLNQNGVFYPGWYGGNWREMNNVMATAYHRADYVFWQSQFCRRAADHFLGRRELPGEVLFNAIDTRHSFRPSSKRSDRPFTFLVTGRIDAHMSYRVESSIAGLHAARHAGLDCHLMVAGWMDRAALAASQCLVSKLGLTAYVEFFGAYTQAQAPSVYQSADAYLMTKYLDPCPNTVLEAMACGLPVVYSASGGVPEQVGPNAGVGVAVDESWNDAMHTPDPEALGEGMLHVARNVRTMGAAARRRAEDEFEITRWIERHSEVFQGLLEKRA